MPRTMNGSPLRVSTKPPSTIRTGCSGGSHGADVVVTLPTVDVVAVVLVVGSIGFGRVDNTDGSVEPVQDPRMTVANPARRKSVVLCMAEHSTNGRPAWRR